MNQTRLNKLVILTLALLSLTRNSAAQSDMLDHGRMGHAAFMTSTVSDYQCLSINPANLGFAPRWSTSRHRHRSRPVSNV